MKQKTKETHVYKWISKSQYVDINTGEIISKKLARRDYTKIRTNKKIKIEGIYGNIEWTHECEKNRQLRLY